MVKKNYRWILLVQLLLVSCSLKDQDVILDVKKIIYKTPEEVVTMLGNPDSTYTIRILNKVIFCQWYEENGIEIQYHDSGLSTDILVKGPHGLSFDPSALKAFNLDIHVPPSQFMEKELIRWYNMDEFAGISFYRVQWDEQKNVKNYTIFFKAK